MFTFAFAVLAAVILTPFSRAQSNSHTVLSTVVLIRSGDRTPQILGDIPSVLTSLGAQQAFTAGSFFRSRYFSSTGSRSGVDKAPLRGLSAEAVDPRETYILALDEQSNVATAQAFMQGFYPPLVLNESTAGLLDPTSILANRSYVRLTSSYKGRDEADINCRSRIPSVGISMRRSIQRTSMIRNLYSLVALSGARHSAPPQLIMPFRRSSMPSKPTASLSINPSVETYLTTSSGKVFKTI